MTEAREPPDTAEPSRSPAQCEHREADAVGTCTRCGDYYCATCAADSNVRALCARCDGIGEIPWEHDRGVLRAWARTIGRLIVAPSSVARRLPVEGSVSAPTAFAAIACSVYLSMASVLLGAVRWISLSLSLSRFNAQDSTWRLWMFEVPHEIGIVVLITPLTVLLSPVALYATVRVLGGRLSLRACARTMAYASGYHIVMAIPLGGIAAFLLFPYFVYRVLEARAQLSPLRRALAIAILLVFVVAVRHVGETMYHLTLAPLVREGIHGVLANL